LFAKFMLRTPTTGWLGFDLGGATVKVAQVVRAGGEYRLRAAAIAPRRVRWNPEELTAEQPLSSADELQAAASVAALGRCTAAAAVLPMTLCDTAHVEVPAGHRRDLGELTELVEAELHQSLAGYLLADWPTPWDDAKRNVIAAPAMWSDQVSRDVAAGRWNCRTIDALPWALARAAALAQPGAEHRTVIALDWGYNRATLCLIHQGVPALVRCLKNCAFQQCVTAVQSLLRLPEADAERLLATGNALENRGNPHRSGRGAARAPRGRDSPHSELLAGASARRESRSDVFIWRRRLAARISAAAGGRSRDRCANLDFARRESRDDPPSGSFARPCRGSVSARLGG
jgi:Tfp pilus assembly PilM family ATPase